LLRLEEGLRGRVIGQDEAVSAVAEAVRRSRAGLSEPDRPSGRKPSWRGHWPLFGDEDRMIRRDMSEYSERHTV
jgi:ATP-dependent Clp protease ATP-binding subunit ClpC